MIHGSNLRHAQFRRPAGCSSDSEFRFHYFKSSAMVPNCSKAASRSSAISWAMTRVRAGWRNLPATRPSARRCPVHLVAFQQFVVGE